MRLDNQGRGLCRHPPEIKGRCDCLRIRNSSRPARLAWFIPRLPEVVALIRRRRTAHRAAVSSQLTIEPARSPRCASPRARRQRRRHERVQIAVQHRVRVALLHAGAQVLHQLIRRQHVVADLVAPADLRLGIFLRRRRSLRAAATPLRTSRAFSISMAIARLRCWLRSVWQATMMPEGTCVMRIALSVLLTCCPPAPDAR